MEAARQLALDPYREADLRRECLQWAVSTAKTGEADASVVERAEAYFRFITAPLSREAIALLQEHQAAVQARASGSIN